MRGSSHVVTHISHATITEMEAGWHGGEEGNKGREVMLMARKVDLKPGENRVRLEGKVRGGEGGREGREEGRGGEGGGEGGDWRPHYFTTHTCTHTHTYAHTCTHRQPSQGNMPPTKSA